MKIKKINRVFENGPPAKKVRNLCCTPPIGFVPDSAELSGLSFCFSARRVMSTAKESSAITVKPTQDQLTAWTPEIENRAKKSKKCWENPFGGVPSLVSWTPGLNQEDSAPMPTIPRFINA